MREAKEKARRACTRKGQQKWEYQCASCRKWYKDKDTQIDHVVPCGSLKRLEDIAGFVERMTPESVDAFQVLCKGCHSTKTQEERKNR